MGNVGSGDASSRSSTGGRDGRNGRDGRDGPRSVFFLLHRTWAVIVTDKWTKMSLKRRQRTNNSEIYGDSVLSDTWCSKYTDCTCSICTDNDFDSVLSSDFFDTSSGDSSMTPNSDDTRRVGSFQRSPKDETLSKEKQRPPIYNPEDYALSLKKWGRRPPANGPGLYTCMTGTLKAELENGRSTSGSGGFRDYRNPMLSSGSEMTLRQFGTVTELLNKLRNDLRLAYPSFVQEFIADPLDGVGLLLEVLRAIQLSQSNQNISSTGTTGKLPPAIQRRALLDELSCLQCLLYCCLRHTEGIQKLTASTGLFTLAVCIMSNVNKSRTIALQLLTKACENNGQHAVSEALSTLRLRFGEPVRFRFLVGMLTSASGQGELLSTGMRFINVFLKTSGSTQRRLYVQAELEQAGFDVGSIKKNIVTNTQFGDRILNELDVWDREHIDAELLLTRLEDSEKENDSLRDKVLLLERRVQILQEEKGILVSLEQCLKERCTELQDEVTSLKSHQSPGHSTGDLKREGSTPEDEGISSSERSLTPEELQRAESVYEIYNGQNDVISLESRARYQGQGHESLRLSETNVADEEEDATIEDVMEELQNIIKDETEDLKKRRKEEAERIRIEEAQVRGKIRMRIEDARLESEIVPSNLHPQPPRRTRSLVHLYVPEDYYSKEIFFENETAYTSESSDSLLSSSKYKNPDNRQILNSIMDAREASNFKELARKSKSLDRIDNGIGGLTGLESMIDIVVADSGNGATLSRSDSKRKAQYENPKMFLPGNARIEPEPRYYFPRIQEKKGANSFLIRRGHGNAGMYSEQNIAMGVITAVTSNSKKEHFASNTSRNSSAALVALNSSVLYAWPSPSIPVLISDFPGNVSLEEASYTTVIPSLASLLSSPLYPYLMNRFGRKPTLLSVVIPQLLAWLLIARAENIYVIYVSRFVSGFASSCVYATLPVYIGEISSPDVRGLWGNAMSCFIYFGLCLMNIIGGFYSLRTAALILGCLPVGFLIIFTFMPESPYFYIMKGKMEKAKVTLKKLRRCDDVDGEFEDMKLGVERQLTEPGNLKDLFVISRNFKCLIVVICIRAAQQFAGISAFGVYAQYIFLHAGDKVSAITSSVIYTSVLTMSACTASIFLDRLGRRHSMIISCSGCSVILLLESAYFYFKPTLETKIPYFPLLGMILYVLLFSLGLGIVPNLILGEVFPSNLKGKALGLANIAYGIYSSASTKIFQLLTTRFGMYAPFLLFGTCCALSTLFSIYAIPETSGRTLEEIQTDLNPVKPNKPKKSLGEII